MLTGFSSRYFPKRVRGFGLIEMMVAIVVGLIVTAGAINLVVAINQANNDTIQSTRLTQELQALASVISDEIKRSRRIHDAYACVGLGSATNCATATNSSITTVTIGTGSSASTVAATDPIDWSTANCVVYSYQDPSLNDTTKDGNSAVNNYRAIRLSGNNVLIASGVAAVTCTSPGVQLNTSQIRITKLQFSCPSGGTSTSCSEIDLTLSGQLTSGDTYTKAITRTVIQPIFVRSGAT